MSTALTFAERLSHMLTGTVIGIGTVFAILIFLWGLLIVMKFIFTPRAPKAKKQVDEVVEAPAAPMADDSQLIAVLTAAVAMMLEAQNVTTSFKIKSFRRTK